MKRRSLPAGAVVPRAWKAPQVASDCWAWVDPEDVLRIALASFYAAVRQSRQHFNLEESWVDWREGFAAELVMEFTERLEAQRYYLGLPDPGGHHREAALRVQRRQLGREGGIGGVAPDAELSPVMQQQHQSASPALPNSAS